MYVCEFPGCNYKTKYKSQITYHHIVPVECGGSDKAFNRIWLCPNHHTRIYIPEATHGIHVTKGENSLMLVGWLQSTTGKVLEYIDESGNTQYHGV